MIARREFESLKERRLNFYSICQKILIKGRVWVFKIPFTPHYIQPAPKERIKQVQK